MKRTFKVFLTTLLTVIIVCLHLLSAYASEEGVAPCLENFDTATMSFTVLDGKANFYVSYVAREETFLEAKLTVQIQKKILGLFWSDVADEWVAYNTDLRGEFYDYIPVDGKGTYRANFELIVYGNHGIADVVEDTIDVKYT